MSDWVVGRTTHPRNYFAFGVDGREVISYLLHIEGQFRPRKNLKMTTENKVRILSTITTRNSSGRHFTSLVSSDDIASLETEGLIIVARPIHEATGIPYGEEHYSVEVTADGVELVEAYPEYCEAAE